jgi:hypothetical protein
MITWSDQPVQLAPTVVNNSNPPTDLTYLWSADPDIGVEFDPNVYIEAPTVTITKDPGDAITVMLTLTVNNVGEPPAKAREDSMTIDVYDDACKAALGKGLAADNPTDLDENCITSFGDFAEMVKKWLVDNALQEPVAKP